MSDAIHKIMITWKSSRRQLGEIFAISQGWVKINLIAESRLWNLQFGVQSFELGVSVCIPRTTN
jgi:hypothetical protein